MCVGVVNVMCGLVSDVLRSSVWDARTSAFSAPTALRRSAYDCCSALCTAFGAGVLRWLSTTTSAGSAAAGGVVLQVLHDVALPVQLRKTRIALAMAAV